MSRVRSQTLFLSRQNKENDSQYKTQQSTTRNTRRKITARKVSDGRIDEFGLSWTWRAPSFIDDQGRIRGEQKRSTVEQTHRAPCVSNHSRLDRDDDDDDDGASLKFPSGCFFDTRAHVYVCVCARERERDDLLRVTWEDGSKPEDYYLRSTHPGTLPP